jgi:uncharacterized protein DUF3305
MTDPVVQVPVGVVVKRAKAESKWIDYTWRPVSVLIGEPDTPPWTVLSSEGDNTFFYAGTATVSLYRSDARHYRDNLGGDCALWIVLRPTGGEPPYELFAVTADPSEGEGFTAAGDDLVDYVPMPDAMRELVAAFIAETPIDESFYKRERKRADPEALARRGPQREGRDE